MSDLNALLARIETSATKIECDKNKNARGNTKSEVLFTPELSTKKTIQYTISEKDVDSMNHISKPELFDLLNMLISTQSNVLLHGYGSFNQIMMQFLMFLKEAPSSVSRVHLFNAFTFALAADFFDELIAKVTNCTKKQLSKTFEDFMEMLEKVSEPVLVIVNNLDNKILLTDQSQQRLSVIAKNKNIVLLGTSGSSSLELYWSSEVKDNFSFFNVEFNTFRAIKHELMPTQVFANTSSMKNSVNLENFFKISSDKVRNAFHVVVKHFKESKAGVPFDFLVRMLVDSMVVNYAEPAEDILNLLLEQSILVQNSDNSVKLGVSMKGIDKLIEDYL